jgi:dsRNA-specific ribonuclease
MDQVACSTPGDAVFNNRSDPIPHGERDPDQGRHHAGKEQLENNTTLVKVVRRLRIMNFIGLDRGKKGLKRDGEDTIEALIGAIFLNSDAGFGVVKQCIGTWSEPELKRVKKEKSAREKPRW